MIRPLEAPAGSSDARIQLHHPMAIISRTNLPVVGVKVARRPPGPTSTGPSVRSSTFISASRLSVDPASPGIGTARSASRKLIASRFCWQAWRNGRDGTGNAWRSAGVSPGAGPYARSKRDRLKRQRRRGAAGELNRGASTRSGAPETGHSSRRKELAVEKASKPLDGTRLLQ